MAKVTYKSTRGAQTQVAASKAIIQGIAEDGGLFVPSHIPKIDLPLESLINLSYHEMAYYVMKDLLSDFSEDELKTCINCAYNHKFDTPEMVDIVKKGEVHFLELFHGPTLAFKDMALSILPYLMTTSMRKQGITDEVVILTATSGDTGKAALEGFADVNGTRIIVFYPKNGVSSIQEKQMVTQKGENTSVVSIEGNFDDAQSGVKRIFREPSFNEKLNEKGLRLSSANSINIGRLIPQIIYYFYGYAQMVKTGEIKVGETINISVPTGNFGNILAAFYAKQMGLPVHHFICASNDNKVLTDFFATREYNKNRDFKLTISPSMDILISSNLERLVYEVVSGDTLETNKLMQTLEEEGTYTVPEHELLQDFYGYCATEKETMMDIKEFYRDNGYIMDTHTAVGYSCYKKYKQETEDERPVLLASTASPYKFGEAVLSALGEKVGKKDEAQIERLNELSKITIPDGIKRALVDEACHDYHCHKDQMDNMVGKILGIFQ